MYLELDRNLPGHPNWEGSFYERLTEYGEWDVDEFWKLHIELVEIANHVEKSNEINRHLAVMLVTLQQRVLNLVSAHFNNSDAFQIVNLESDLVYEFKERFELAILGAFTGQVFPESSFDLINPLISGA